MDKKVVDDILLVFGYAMDNAGEVSPELGELADTRGWVRPQEVHREMSLFSQIALDEVEDTMSRMAREGLLVKVSVEDLATVPTRMTFYKDPLNPCNA